MRGELRVDAHRVSRWTLSRLRFWACRRHRAALEEGKAEQIAKEEVGACERLPRAGEDAVATHSTIDPDYTLVGHPYGSRERAR